MRNQSPPQDGKDIFKEEERVIKIPLCPHASRLMCLPRVNFARAIQVYSYSKKILYGGVHPIKKKEKKCTVRYSARHCKLWRQQCRSHWHPPRASSAWFWIRTKGGRTAHTWCLGGRAGVGVGVVLCVRVSDDPHNLCTLCSMTLCNELRMKNEQSS